MNNYSLIELAIFNVFERFMKLKSLRESMMIVDSFFRLYLGERLILVKPDSIFEVKLPRVVISRGLNRT